jgi:tetratricopeptide (TPR) repeat protein
MTTIEMTEPRLECPASGPMLRELIHAFRLGREGASGTDSSLVGSAVGERNERRYFKGQTVVPKEVRQRVAAKVATALIEAGLVEDLRLSPESGFSTADGVFAAAVSNWVATWDAVYHQCSVGWPYIPRSLGVFVLGREVVIDLVQRVAAVLHLSGSTSVDWTIHAAHDGAGASILNAAIGREMSYSELAAAAHVDPRTAQRWLNESLAPEDHNLRQLAHAVAGADRAREKALLRHLRIHYGVLRLSQRLETLCGPRWSRDLMQSFERFLNCAIQVTQEIDANPRAFDSTAEGIELAQVELLTVGGNSVVAPTLISLWLHWEHPAIWAYELHLARSMSLKERLERCFQTIGNWPQFWTNGLPANEVLGLSAAEYQTRLESVALATLCPALREMIEQQPPAHSDVGLPCDLEHLIHRAISCQTDGSPEGALPLWRQVLQRVPDNADYHCYYGIALRATGQRQEALEALRRAADLDPASDRPPIEIAHTYLQQGVPDLALHHLEGVRADVRERSAELLWVMAELLFLEMRYPDALAAAEQSLALDPENADAHDLAARCLVRLPQTRERREQAARHAKKAASSHRLGGLTEWQNTKRHRSS